MPLISKALLADIHKGVWKTMQMEKGKGEIIHPPTGKFIAFTNLGIISLLTGTRTHTHLVVVVMEVRW